MVSEHSQCYITTPTNTIPGTLSAQLLGFDVDLDSREAPVSLCLSLPPHSPLAVDALCTWAVFLLLIPVTFWFYNSLLQTMDSCETTRLGAGFCIKHFPHGSDGKVSAYNAGNPGSIPGLGRSSGEGNGNPLQYS